MLSTAQTKGLGLIEGATMTRINKTMAPLPHIKYKLCSTSAQVGDANAVQRGAVVEVMGWTGCAHFPWSVTMSPIFQGIQHANIFRNSTTAFQNTKIWTSLVMGFLSKKSF